MAAMQVRVMSGASEGDRLILEGSKRVGTGEACDLRLQDPMLRAESVRITPQETTIDVEVDGQCDSGLWQGIRRLSRLECREYEEFRIGPVVFRLEPRTESRYGPRKSFGRFIGSASVLQGMYEGLRGLAATDAMILLLGRRGSGKHHLAECVHEMGARHDGPFIAVCCEDHSEPALARFLFGSETNASAFAQAQGGTLLLDGIQAVPLSVQHELLGLIDGRRIPATDSANAGEDINVRLIASASEPLDSLVEQGQFRRDLFHRMSGNQIRVPSLDERPEDIPAIAARFTYLLGLDASWISEANGRALQSTAWADGVASLACYVDQELGPMIRAVYPVPDTLDAVRELSKLGYPFPLVRHLTDEIAAEQCATDALAAYGSLDSAVRASGLHRSDFFHSDQESNPSTLDTMDLRSST